MHGYSPTVIGTIRMGIEMFKYRPCLIWNLLKEGSGEGLTCDMVFLYLLYDYQLIPRLLHHKLYGN